MPNRPKDTIAKQLNAAQLAIVNSLADAEIGTAVATYGYDTGKLSFRTVFGEESPQPDSFVGFLAPQTTLGMTWAGRQIVK